MAEMTTYSLDELVAYRDALLEIIDHLDAHPTENGSTYKVKSDLRQTGFSLHVKFGKDAKLPILPPSDGTLCVQNFAHGGFNAAMLLQVLDQLVNLMQRVEGLTSDPL